MVEQALTSLLEHLKDDSNRHLDVKHIKECLEKANKVEIAENVFTKCIKKEEGYFECITDLLSFGVILLDVPYLGTVVNVIRLIGKLCLHMRNKGVAFPMISENLESELSEKLRDIREDFYAFYARFDVRSNDLHTFKQEGNKSKERVERLLDELSYKEIGMRFTGKLEAGIERYTCKNILKEETLKAVGEMLNVYVRVAIMRRAMQFSILSIISDEEMESAIKQIQVYMEFDALRRVDFLTKTLQPSHKNAIFLSSFRISKFPLLDVFLKTKGLTQKAQPWLEGMNAFLKNKRIALQSVKFSDYWMESPFIGCVWRTLSLPWTNGEYFFEAESEEDDIFLIKSCDQNTYVYMKSNSFLSQTSTRPTEEGMFKILRLQSNTCLISVMKYPGRFIYMTNIRFGRIKGSVTDKEYTNGFPTEQHEWSLMENRFLVMCNIFCVENELMDSCFS